MSFDRALRIPPGPARPPRLPGLFTLLAILAAVFLPWGDAPRAQPDPDPADQREFEMVLVHGLGGNATVWDDVLPYLQRTFKVWVFELSGHGKTQPVLNPSIVEEAGRLRDFITREGIRYPTIVGHGMGGMIALQYALDHPADVHRLILMDTAPKQLAGPEQKAEVAKMLVEDYDRFVAARYLNTGPDPDICQEVMDIALRTDSATFITMLMGSFDFDLTARLGGLSVPLLVVGSELMFPSAETSQAVLEQIGFGHARSLTFKRMPATGHYMMMERPVHLASVLMAFGVTAGYEFKP